MSQLRNDRACEPARREAQGNVGAELLREAALDQTRPETATGRWIYGGPSGLRPVEMQAALLRRATDRPCHQNSPRRIGECAVLCRICRKFLESHRKAQCRLRLEPDERTG